MEASIPLKPIVAAPQGGIVGLERRVREKQAGLRTNILICVGSTLFMSISAKVAQVRILQRLSEVPAISQVEAGSDARDFASVPPPEHSDEGDRAG